MLQIDFKLLSIKFAVLGAILFLVTVALGCRKPGLPSTPEETSANFSYSVRVVNAGTNENIPNAKVDLEVSGLAPLRGVTGADGFVRIFVAAVYVNKPARLSVTADGYESYRLEIDLYKGTLPETILLRQATPISGSIPTISTEEVTAPPVVISPVNPNTFTCLVFDYAGYLPLLQIVQDKLDEQNGFHLEIIPYYLPTPDNRYDISFDTMVDNIRSGQWDCVTETNTGVAFFGDYGVITAVTSESAGADQVWVSSDVHTINDFKGRRIVYVAESDSEFLLLALLDLVGLTQNDVTVLPVEGEVRDAVQMFNSGNADIVIGWEPGITDAARRQDANKLIDSSQIRYLLEIILTSRKAIERKPATVQAFHRAWFQAVKAQIDNFGHSANSIASWGHSDWTSISSSTAETDLRLLLESVAQASYGPNVFIMQNPSLLRERVAHSRSIWGLADASLAPLDMGQVVDPQFVLALQEDMDSVLPVGKPINPSFSLSGQPQNPRESLGIPIATLPCEKFQFLPDSSILTIEGQNLLEELID